MPATTTPAPAAATPAPAAGGESNASKVDVWKMVLYERCKELGEMFTQEDLLRLDVIPNGDLQLLIDVIQALSNDKLLITMRDPSGQVLWKWRDAQEAHK
jgi:DNA-directed RNA polymerase III subunit RPC6